MAAVKDIFVSRSALETIRRLEKEDGLGLLIGEDSIDFIKVWKCTRLSERVQEDAMKTCQLLPGGLTALGLYSVSSAPTASSATGNDSEDSNDPLSSVISVLMNFLKVKYFLLLNYDDTNPHSSAMFLYSCIAGDVKRTRSEWTAVAEEGNLKDEHVRFRLKTQLPLSFKYDPKSDKLIKTIRTEVEHLCQLVGSPSTVFHINDSKLLLSPDSMSNNEVEEDEDCEQQYWKSYESNEMCRDIVKYIETDEENFITMPKSKKKNAGSLNRSISVSMYTSTFCNTDPKRTPSCAPLIHQEMGEFLQVSVPLKIDAIAYVSLNCPISKVASILATAVCRQILAAELCITENRQGSTFSIPQTYHIQLPQSTFIVSVTYPEDVEENTLEYQRKCLHQLFCLPLTKPCFRKTNAYIFPEDVAPRNSYLINPHVSLLSAAKSATQHVVQGRCSYHHYMQDNCDDNKWGCAYRSLQTLISWFRLQGYTSAPVPTHRQIQQALVDIGDKQPPFVGSRQWIGSLEVSFCLEHLIGVQSRIMNVSSGAEMSNYGRELSMHFDSVGTPIMIGGGVLAHTIIGVDYNEVTGNMKFLILDPHYTGEEDLQYILNKGWCGWKGPNFWDKNAHYNLCMPQRPKVI
ncbi:ufm1-specific protease 2-like [Octopus sinensis]|uniref:Ufm1-specific protease 2-like n=1 Tax=Octopus sinensis TaxID=2607531 RepID=A0A6P7TEK0_9MOLL|nr:ufm1-specific protease 2-like [Octopus sinensis]